MKKLLELAKIIDRTLNRGELIEPNTTVHERLSFAISHAEQQMEDDAQRMKWIQSHKPFNNVTTINLDLALRMVNIQISKDLLNRIIDVVGLIERKSDDVSIKDICKLQKNWKA